MDKDKLKKAHQGANTYMKYSSLGVQMIVTLLLCAWGGVKLDKYFALKIPAFTIGLLLFGIVASLIYFIVKVSKPS